MAFDGVVEVAVALGVSARQVSAVLGRSVAPLAQRSYYHYLAGGAAGGGDSSAPRPGRHVLLFRSPDDALAFARQVRIPETPRVRPISAELLVLRLLADERLACLIFLEQSLERLPPGLTRDGLPALPGAYVLRRADLLAAVRAE